MIRLSCFQQEQRSLGHRLVAMSLWAQKVVSYLVDGVSWPITAEPQHHNLFPLSWPSVKSLDVLYNTFCSEWNCVLIAMVCLFIPLFLSAHTALSLAVFRELFIHGQTQMFQMTAHCRSVWSLQLGSYSWPCNQNNQLVSTNLQRDI